MSATNKPLTLDPARAGESNVPRILGLGITFHALALVAVALRMYTRIVIVKAFGWDDAMLLLCIVGLFGGGMVTIIVAVNHGLGHHAATLSDHDLIVYGKTVFVQAMLTTTTSLCLLKLSVGFSLLRLSSPMNRWWRRTIVGLMIFICLYLVESWISILAFCTPIAAQWDKKLLKTARCWPQSVFRIFPLVNTGCNMFTDISFASLPIPIIWRLQMKQRTRIYLVGIFSLGYIAVIIGVFKCISQIKNRGDPDAVFHNWTQTLGFLQQNVGVVAACAPALKPLLGRWLKLPNSSLEYYGSGRRGNVGSRGPQKNKSSVGYSCEAAGGYELEGLPGRGGGFGDVDKYHHRTTVARRGTSPTSSEERIIGWDSADMKGGVLKTTEVTITR